MPAVAIRNFNPRKIDISELMDVLIIHRKPLAIDYAAPL